MVLSYFHFRVLKFPLIWRGVDDLEPQKGGGGHPPIDIMYIFYICM